MKYAPTIVPTLLLSLVITLPTLEAAAKQSDFELEVSKPKFVLPQFSGPYREREASIAPEEYERAESLKTLLEGGDTEAVLKELEQFYDIELSPAMQTLKAQVYFSLQKYDKAEETYLSVLRRKPQLVRVHSDLGQLYLLTEKPQKARTHFAKAVEFGANEPIIHGQLAYLNLTQYGPYSAISHYQQALALEPDNSQWSHGLLAALTKAQMFSSATALMTEMLARTPNESELWLNNATLLLHQDKNLEALSSLETAMLLGDSSERNLRVAAQLHIENKSYDRANELVFKHLSSVSFDIDTLSAYLSQLERLGRWKDAEKLMKSIKRPEKKYSETELSQFYVHQALISSHKGSNGEAETLFKKSIELDPLNGQALLEYAKLSLKAKNFVESELYFIRAEALDNVEKSAILGLSQMYVESQDYDAALKQLRKAQLKFPHTADLAENITIIENIIKNKQLNKRK